ncbi:MAG: hypothetical protein AAF849_18310 [Bacteroidota bacterium]
MKKTLKKTKITKTNFKKSYLIYGSLAALVIGIAIAFTLLSRSDCYKIRQFQSNLDAYSKELLLNGENAELSIAPQNSSEAERFFMKKFYRKNYKQLVNYLEHLKAKCDPIRSTHYSKGAFVVCKYRDSFLSSLLKFDLKNMKSPRTFSVLIRLEKDQTAADVIVDIYRYKKELITK